jgi:hypothetical protein
MSAFHYTVTDNSTSATSFEYTVRLNGNEALAGRVKATLQTVLFDRNQRTSESQAAFPMGQTKDYCLLRYLMILNILIVGQKG